MFTVTVFIKGTAIPRRYVGLRCATRFYEQAVGNMHAGASWNRVTMTDPKGRRLKEATHP